MHRILFIGNSSLYSAAHLAALGRAGGVAAVVEAGGRQVG